MKLPGLPFKPDRWLYASVACGAAIFVAAVGWPERHEPRPDFSAVQVVEGRLFCVSYTSRNGSSFRIDDVAYVGGHCSRAQHGFHGPRVRASWVQLPGPERRRMLLTVMNLQTGGWVLHRSPEDVERQMQAWDHSDDMVKLYAAMVGAALVLGALVRGHARAVKAQNQDSEPLRGGSP